MIFIIYFTQREILSAFKRRLAYLRDFWSYPEVGIIVCSWAALGLYIWRIGEGNHVGELFKETKGYTCVNLQLAAYVNDVLTYLLAFCCFFGTIKFLRLLRFNRHIAMLSSTMAYAFKDLISFAFMFSFLFLAFLALFFLLFQSKLWTCADLVQAAQMLSQMMLLKYNVSDLIKAGSFLGPFCFTLFMIFVVFICMNMVCRKRTKENYENRIVFIFSLFRLSWIHFELLELIVHYKVGSMKSLVLRLINSRNGRVRKSMFRNLKTIFFC